MKLIPKQYRHQTACSSKPITSSAGKTNLIRTAVAILLTLVIAGVNAEAREGIGSAYVLPQEHIESIYKDFIYEHVSWPKSDVIITNVSTREQINLPADTFTYEALPLSNESCIGNTILKIIFKVDGKEVKRVQVSGHIDIEAAVLCASRALRRHEILMEKDLCIVRRSITNYSGATLRNTEEAVGYRLTGSLRAGETLRKDLIEPAPIIKKGDRVTILAETDNVVIKAAGEAQEDAPKGGVIRVRYLEAKKIIYARVISTSTVKIEL